MSVFPLGGIVPMGQAEGAPAPVVIRRRVLPVDPQPQPVQPPPPPPSKPLEQAVGEVVQTVNIREKNAQEEYVASALQQYLEGVVQATMIWNWVSELKNNERQAVEKAQAIRNIPPVSAPAIPTVAAFTIEAQATAPGVDPVAVVSRTLPPDLRFVPGTPLSVPPNRLADFFKSIDELNSRNDVLVVARAIQAIRQPSASAVAPTPSAYPIVQGPVTVLEGPVRVECAPCSTGPLVSAPGMVLTPAPVISPAPAPVIPPVAAPPARQTPPCTPPPQQVIDSFVEQTASQVASLLRFEMDRTPNPAMYAGQVSEFIRDRYNWCDTQIQRNMEQAISGQIYQKIVEKVSRFPTIAYLGGGGRSSAPSPQPPPPPSPPSPPSTGGGGGGSPIGGGLTYVRVG